MIPSVEGGVVSAGGVTILEDGGGRRSLVKESTSPPLDDAAVVGPVIPSVADICDSAGGVTTVADACVSEGGVTMVSGWDGSRSLVSVSTSPPLDDASVAAGAEGAVAGPLIPSVCDACVSDGAVTIAEPVWEG